jgi:hypothetical protein
LETWWRLHPVLEEWNLFFHFFWLAFVPSSPVAAKLCSPQYRASLQRRGTGGQCLEDCIEKILNFPLINETPIMLHARVKAPISICGLKFSRCDDDFAIAG